VTESPLRLLGQRRFLPLFITQFLNAFNDNLFKMAMVVLVTFTIYQDPKQEESFNALAGGIFILPFFLLSAISGQLADSRDKAWLVRIIKSAEIAIMAVGAIGILMSNVPIMLLALFAMGVHSTFFGPIKYAILPQHLDEDHVLAGTGMVEAGTYVAILLGTIVGGLLPSHWAAVAVLGVAIIGRVAAGFVPPAPPDPAAPKLDFNWNIFTASWRQVSDTMHIQRLFRAIMAISFFWAVGAIFAAQFPPLVKNILNADKTVATLFTSLFSIGIAIGSVAVNQLLKGKVSAKYSPVSVIIMGLFVLDLWWTTQHWTTVAGPPMDWLQFAAIGQADRIIFDLLGISIAGGMFVVPLYAFLTTTVAQTETARTIAVLNIVTSAAMVLAALLLILLAQMSIGVANSLLIVAGGSLVAAWIAQLLHKASD
jgi:predicted MFS family arabinose efflux permease